MPAVVGYGDRITTLGGRESWLKRGSVPFSQYTGGGVIRLAGGNRTASFAQLYEEHTWVHICVNAMFKQLSSLPLKVYTLGSQNERVRVTDGPLPDLLRKPWPRARPVHLKQKVAFPMLVHGNAVLRKVRAETGGPPVALAPLDWRILEPDIYEGQVTHWKLRYEDRDEVIPVDETAHFYWESANGACGTSPMTALGVTVRNEEAAQRSQTSSFENGTRPSLAVTLDKDSRWDDETRRVLMESIEATHSGPDKQGRPFVVGGGATVEALSHTAVEAQLIEQRHLNREEIAAVYGVPQSMVGILDHATYSNIDEQHKMFYMTVLRPWLTLIEETFEAHLVDGERAFEGQALEFDLSEILKGDAKERAEAFMTFLNAGVYTVNELRKMENLPRIDHPLADSPLIPANNLAPIDEEAEESDPTGVAPMLASHIARAEHLYQTKKNGTGNPHFDPVRFKRELTEDLEPKLGPGADIFAGIWAAAIEQGVEDPSGDPEQFFQALT